MYKTIIKKIGLFLTAGYIYYFIECLYRGYSDISMFILAGLLAVFCIDTPNNIYGFDLDYIIQILISTILCTIGEGCCGLVVNVWLKQNVWDYSQLIGTFFFGQCNIFFMFAWALLIGLIGIPYCDAYNYYICKNGERPYYKVFGKIIFRLKERKDL